MELRDMQLSDADQVLAWRNAPHVRSVMFSDDIITPDQHRAWIERTLDADDSAYWIISHGGQDLGVANLAEINRRHLRCSWAYYLGEPDAPAPVGLAVEFRVMELAFTEFGMNKLISEVLASNDRVVALHEHVGFVREGTLRAHVTRSDGVHDVVVLSMLREEWTKKHGGRRR